jgi:hypothetical protein
MLRFFICAALWAAMLPAFLRWGRAQAEYQIDKMQKAVFNTPGSEAPIPPQVAITGFTLLSIHGLVSRWLGVRGFRWGGSLMVGTVAGGLFWLNKRD